MGIPAKAAPPTAVAPAWAAALCCSCKAVAKLIGIPQAETPFSPRPAPPAELTDKPPFAAPFPVAPTPAAAAAAAYMAATELG